jgi:peroxiredoxin
MTMSSRHGRIARAVLAGAAAAALIGAAFGATGAANPARVDDFQLADQNFLARHLYKMKDAKAVVLITYAAGDAAVKAEAKDYMALKTAYADKGVEVMMLDSRLGETRDKVKADAKAAGIDMPILFDYQQLVGESLGVTRAAETIVIDPRTWSVAYRGPVSGAAKTVTALVAGEKVAPTQVAAKGGVIAFPEKAKAGAFAKISYAKEVAPIIQEKCATCHQPGGVAPMQLNNYEQIKGFAPMIREVIRTQRMPPYLADPTVGHFKDDERLTPAQIKTLVHWIEAGAPRGAGEDPLAKVKFQAPEWPLGKPDVIVEIPAIKIPASGVLDYTRPVVPNVMTEGRWMKATTFRITDKKVVHHILTGVVAGTPKAGDTASESSWGASIGGYGPGRGSNLTPPDMGVWIPASGGVAFQNHYTPYGKETVEKTQMGLYFYPKGQEPKYVMRTFGIFDFGINIPAKAEYHPEVAYIDIPKEMLIYGITPHAHTRGGSANVAIVYPNGKEEMILALPKYDFNWQYEYFLAEPLKAPAGSRIVTRWTYDNSTRNKSNPDPLKDVSWGEQTSEEMLALYLHYRWTDETVAVQKPEYEALLQGGLMMGVLDDNLDGKLQQSELRGRQAAVLKANFALLDANKDGAADKDEMAAAMKFLSNRNRQAAPPAAAAPAAEAAPTAGNKPAVSTN